MLNCVKLTYLYYYNNFKIIYTAFLKKQFLPKNQVHTGWPIENKTDVIMNAFVIFLEKNPLTD